MFLPVHLLLTAASFALDCAPAPAPPCPPGTPAPGDPAPIANGASAAADVARFNPYVASHPGAVRRVEEEGRAAFCVKPGLAYEEYSCQVSRQSTSNPSATVTRTLQFHETRMSRGAGLAFGAIPNPEGRPMGAEGCHHGYVGGSPARILGDRGEGSACRRTHAVSNGSFFSTYTPRDPLEGGRLAISGLSWTVRPDGAAGSAGLQSVLKRNEWNPESRTPLFIADADGGHEIMLSIVDCPPPNPTNDVCATVVPETLDIPANRRSHFLESGSPRVFSGAGLIAALREHAYPTMTSAMQINSPDGGISYGQIDETGNLSVDAGGGCRNPVGFQCRDDRGHRNVYRSSSCGTLTHPGESTGLSTAFACQNHPRTLLCARNDGSISLLTVSRTDLYTLSIALRTGSGCGIDCDRFYNFDGGGSTQMAARNPGDPAHPHVSGERATTSAGMWAEPPCGPYRAPANFLSIYGGCE